MRYPLAKAATKRDTLTQRKEKKTVYDKKLEQEVKRNYETVKECEEKIAELKARKEKAVKENNQLELSSVDELVKAWMSIKEDAKEFIEELKEWDRERKETDEALKSLDRTLKLWDRVMKKEEPKEEIIVKCVGFGIENKLPCYEDEAGKLYFAMKDELNRLDFYTGAYKNILGDILGEPKEKATVKISWDIYNGISPKSSRRFDYMLLDRLRSDCEYYIARDGKCRETTLWADIDRILEKMEELMESFRENEKPQWLTEKQFASLKKRVLTVKQNTLSRSSQATRKESEGLSWENGKK